jgi:hypothetical protein
MRSVSVTTLFATAALAYTALVPLGIGMAQEKASGPSTSGGSLPYISGKETPVSKEQEEARRKARSQATSGEVPGVNERTGSAPADGGRPARVIETSKPVEPPPVDRKADMPPAVTPPVDRPAAAAPPVDRPAAVAPPVVRPVEPPAREAVVEPKPGAQDQPAPRAADAAPDEDQAPAVKEPTAPKAKVAKKPSRQQDRRPAIAQREQIQRVPDAGDPDQRLRPAPPPGYAVAPNAGGRYAYQEDSGEVYYYRPRGYVARPTGPGYQYYRPAPAPVLKENPPVVYNYRSARPQTCYVQQGFFQREVICR